MARDILQKSLQNAGFSIIFQIICRIVTFGINAFIVRRVGREILGVMNVRLLLLESTLLFLSREAINRASLSSTSQHKKNCSWAQLINQMWLTVPLCLVLCIPCVYIWLHILSPVDDYLKLQYKFACYAVAISCIIELSAEAPVFVSQVFCFIKFKILMNTLYILLRSVIFIWIVLNNQNIAITAFGVAQISSAVTMILGNYTFFHFYIKKLQEFKKLEINNDQKQHLLGDDEEEEEDVTGKNDLFKNMEDFPFTNIKEMLPGVLPNHEKALNPELQTLTLSFVKQGVLKQILTEGEKYVMSVSPVLSFSEQATYDVVNNLGSLAARFIFRPIEDSAYFYFTQSISRDTPLKDQKQEKILEAGNVLNMLCMCVASIGLLAFTFGQSYSYTVLLLYGGEDFVAGGLPETLLKWHCLAIFLMAVNGVTEGYMFATNTSKDIDKYNYYMAIFSVCFLLLSYILTSIFGPVGFIFANCTNMICRILYSIAFIKKQFKFISINPLEGIAPRKLFLTILVIAGLSCKYSEVFFKGCVLCHLGVGLVAGLLCVGGWCLENKKLVGLVLKKYGKKFKIK